MIKTINSKEYDLMMTRKGVRKAEEAGMNINDVADKPMSALTYLWYASIYNKHPMSFDKATNLLDDYLDESNETFDSLMEYLSEEYSKVFGLAVE